MTGYSATTDLLVGDIPLPTYISTAKFVTDAADEIDSHIGFVYKTPISVVDVPENPVSRPARLLLKRISTHLSSGRILMSVAAAGEDNALHAYGYNLVKEALAALAAIVKGEILLDGAEPVDGVDTGVPTGPMISNLDEVSLVEQFYDRARNPSTTDWIPRPW